MRKYLAWILIALCALLPTAALAVENRNTQITTVLPREHTITVVCGENGVVRVEGTVYAGTCQLTVDRLAAFALEAVPDAGYRFSQVQAQPSGGVSVSGNTVTIDSVYEDKTLTLSFGRDQVEPTPTVNPTPTISSTSTAGEDIMTAKMAIRLSRSLICPTLNRRAMCSMTTIWAREAV